MSETTLVDDVSATPREPVGKQVMSGGVWSGVSQLLPLVGTMVLSIVAARILGPDELGHQSLIVFAEAALAALVVNSLTDTTIRTLAVYHGAGDQTAQDGVARWSMAAHVASGCVTGAVLVGIGLGQSHDRTAWIVVGLSAVVNAIGWAYAARIVAQGGWRPVAIRRLVFQLLAIALGIAAVAAGLGVTGLFAANVVAATGLWWALRRAAPGCRTARWGGIPWGPIRMWGVFTVMEVLTQIVSRRVEFVFLGVYSTARELAMYSIPFMVVSAAAVVPLSIAGAAMPAMASASGAGKLEHVTTRFRWALRMASMCVLPLVALLASLGPLAVTVVYGDDYHRAATLVPLASLALVVAPLGALCSSYWEGAGRLWAVVVAGIAGAVVDLGLAFALIPGHGALGAVIANLGGQMSMAAVLIPLTRRAVGSIDLRFDRWLRCLIASLVALVVARLIAVIVGGLLGVAAGGVAGLAAFFVTAAVGGLLRPDDAHWLRAILPAPFAPLVRLLTVR